jgi:hypothetical protein
MRETYDFRIPEHKATRICGLMMARVSGGDTRQVVLDSRDPRMEGDS